MKTRQTYRGRSIMQMTPEELRAALQETVRSMEAEDRRGLTIEDVGTGGIDRAFERATRP
jgi:hypothetical protein